MSNGFDARPRGRPVASRPPTVQRSHSPRARGDARDPPRRGAMPGPRPRRCGPLRCSSGPAARRPPGNSLGRPRDAQVGRFSGFQISRFPRTHHAPHRPRRSAAGWRRGLWESGNLGIWRPAGCTPRTLKADDQWGLTTHTCLWQFSCRPAGSPWKPPFAELVEKCGLLRKRPLLGICRRSGNPGFE